MASPWSKRQSMIIVNQLREIKTQTNNKQKPHCPFMQTKEKKNTWVPCGCVAGNLGII